MNISNTLSVHLIGLPFIFMRNLEILNKMISGRKGIKHMDRINTPSLCSKKFFSFYYFAELSSTLTTNYL